MREVEMQAKVGDRLVVHGAHVSDHERDGEIIEVHGADGAPPYLVRWNDSGHESLVYPGPGTEVVHPPGDASG
jgi:hypothetical protein